MPIQPVHVDMGTHPALASKTNLLYMHTHTHIRCHLVAARGSGVANRYRRARHPTVKTCPFSPDEDSAIMAYCNANCDVDGRLISGSWTQLSMILGREGEALVMVVQ
jgi:hypothetical protein